MSAFRTGAIVTTQAATARSTIFEFTPMANTSWKSTIVSGYLQTYSATEARLGEVYLQVSEVDAFEARLHITDKMGSCVIVLPFGTGLSFSGSQIVSWDCFPATAGARWVASFLGQRT